MTKKGKKKRKRKKEKKKRGNNGREGKRTKEAGMGKNKGKGKENVKSKGMHWRKRRRTRRKKTVDKAWREGDLKLRRNFIWIFAGIASRVYSNPVPHTHSYYTHQPVRRFRNN